MGEEVVPIVVEGRARGQLAPTLPASGPSPYPRARRQLRQLMVEPLYLLESAPYAPNTPAIASIGGAKK